MNRTSFLIDGFNLYHSIRDIYTYHHIRAKWLDIHSLCSSLLSWVGNKATLHEIFYFSSYAYHLKDPGVILRHETYIRCLKATGIQDVMGRFKAKTISCPQFNCGLATCPNCNGEILRHEEKETDVAIATKLLELLSKQTETSCRTVVLVTGDTDIAPTIRTAKALFPAKSVRIVFPYRRKNNELAQLAPSVNLKPHHYQKHQLPDPFPLPELNLSLLKPLSW